MQSIHKDFACDGCGCSPIKGTRYKCKICEDYDLCEKCHKTTNHNHQFAEIKIPIPNLQLPTKVIHPTIICDGCSMNPLIGNRYKCSNCSDFDLCQKCYQVFPHNKSHNFLCIAQPSQTFQHSSIIQPAHSEEDLELVKPRIFRHFGFFGKKIQTLGIPLKSIMYRVEIINGIAKTIISQTYMNTSDQYIETEFLFPIEINACFDRFEARFQSQIQLFLYKKFKDQIIQGVIKEKEEAQEEYKQNKQQGNTVAYSEIQEDSPDVMKIDIGNIPPHTEVQICYSYLQELSVTLNSFWRYTIPSTLTPRYSENPNKESSLQNITTINPNSQNAYTWEIQVKIEQTSKIVNIDSPSHKLLLLQQNPDQTQMELMVENIEKQMLPNKDFVLLFKNEECRVPSVTLGRSSYNQVCAMLTFIPNFANCQMDDALKQSHQDAADFPIDLDAARGEYIFLIDRSGSMSGSRIEYAKEALIFFLKSMPAECYFNIISFGDKFSSMFESSVKYQQDKLKEAINKVNQFKADFGGTKIYQPLSEIFNTPRKKNYPRQVFLLTDGDVSDPQKVIQLIQMNNEFNRVHAIGIGSGASTYLVKNCAKNGKGNYTFVQNPEDISGSIVKMLEQSLTPCLDNFIFKFDQNLIDIIIPTPSAIPCILKNEPFCIYIFFKPEMQDINTQISLVCYDSSINQNLEFPIIINEKNCQFRSEVCKLGISKMIKCFEDETFQTRSIEASEDIFKAKLNNLKSQLVQLSVQHQILSTKTAFICVVKTVADEMAPVIQQQQKLDKIIIPSIESADYAQSQLAKVNMSFPSLKKKCRKPMGQRGGRGGQGAMGRAALMGIGIMGMETIRFDSKPASNLLKLEENYAALSYSKKEKKLSDIKMKKQKDQQCKIQKVCDEIDIEDEEEEKCQELYPIMQDTTIYKEIINQVEMEGYWKTNTNLLAKIIKQKKNLEEFIPEAIKQLNSVQEQDIWMTIIILTWLQLKQAHTKSEWLLIEKKVLNWLKKVTQDTWKQSQENAVSLF